MPERFISNNILIAYEVLHSLPSIVKVKLRYMALKIDMSNAYDRIEWVFIKEVMLKLGFRVQWVNWIMERISIVTS